MSITKENTKRSNLATNKTKEKNVIKLISRLSIEKTYSTYHNAMLIK